MNDAKDTRSKKLKVVLFEDDSDAEAWFAAAKSRYYSHEETNVDIEEHIISNESQIYSFFLEDYSIPELLIVDLKVNSRPKAGLEAIEFFRRKAPHKKMPIIVFSLANGESVREEAYKSGATSFVKKPVNTERRILALVHIFKYWIDLDERQN